MYKYLFGSALLLLLTACSSNVELREQNTSSNNQENVHSEKSTDGEEQDHTEEKTVDEELVIEVVEPAGTMDDWGSYTSEQKLAKIQECLDYEIKKQEQNKTPIVVEGLPEEFVQIIDNRYEEIQGMDGFEKYRMSGSSIAAQVGIMGAKNDVLKFWYEVDDSTLKENE